MSKTKKVLIWLAAIIIVVAIVVIFTMQKKSNPNEIRIGIIEPLTGDLAYWGQSSALGARLAEKELQQEGINVKLIIEDGKLDSKAALSAAQKLVTIDKVDAIYDEFNPIVIPVASYLKDKNIFNLYYSAPVSILADNPNTIKSYLNYEESCKEVSQLLKNRGIDRVGVLKVNLEFGELCLKGIKDVYGDNIAVETYNTDDQDVRTQLTKLNQTNPQVIFNAAFQPDTLTSLKNMKSLGIKAKFVGLSELDADILDKNPGLFEGTILFGMPQLPQDFIDKLKTNFPNEKFGYIQGAGAPYIHIKQIAYALRDCNKELSCVKEKIAQAKPESIIGFQGFKDRIAFFDTDIVEVINNKFIPITQ